MKMLSTAEWITLIADTAHDRVAWNSKADCSPWDSFYSEYRDATVEQRHEVDQAFLESLDSEDPRVVDVAVTHAHCPPAPVAVTRLLRLLLERSTYLLAHTRTGSEQSLLCAVLDVLASRAESAGIDAQLQVRHTILQWAPVAGPFQSGVGTFFGGLGPEAVDALVAVLPNNVDNARMLADAGYELHRSPERWSHALAIADKWSQRHREALQRGGADHAARFPTE
jgi:hypothetical protein